MKINVNKAKFVTVVMIAALVPAVAAAASVGLTAGGSFCDLVKELGGLLKTLRTLAFIGAGFLIAQWAWEFISKPQDVKLETFKQKGVGMLVGFALLFSVGAILTFFINAAGPGGSMECASEFFNW